ncbi:MAG TPA: GntR family transcriptional regulator [Chloroflexota bacterium]|nr:GntR family transcriptional regulator [Chloroflexota bacterium]
MGAQVHAIAEMTAAPEERRTAQQTVYDHLRTAILSGRLLGGSRLVQEDVAGQLGVSRVPVREALLQLAADGIVRMEAHRGASVVWLSPAEVAEIFDIRALLIRRAVQLVVPPLTDDQLSRLEDVARRQERTAGMRQRRKLNQAFYATLFERLDRPRLRSMLDKLESEVERFLQPLERPHIGHLELVEACRRRDGDRAAELAARHLEEVGRRAVARLTELVNSETPFKGEPHGR